MTAVKSLAGMLANLVVVHSITHVVDLIGQLDNANMGRDNAQVRSSHQVIYYYAIHEPAFEPLISATPGRDKALFAVHGTGSAASLMSPSQSM